MTVLEFVFQNRVATVIKMTATLMCRIQRAELGYLISGADLDSDEPLDAVQTSIRSLAERKSATTDFDTLLRGNVSFGALIERYGFDAVPSPKYHGPGAGNPFFSGGYLTREHGSVNGGKVDAIQIESARSFREPSTRGRYAKSLACALRDYVCMHYFSDEEPYPPGCTDDYQSFCSGQPRTFWQLPAIMWPLILISSPVINACF